MNDNKLWKIIDKEFISYYGGTGHKISNGECGFWLWHNKEESQKVCDRLNFICDKNEELNDKIDRFEFILQEAIRTERTDMGKNVLIQLADNLGVDYV